MGKKRGGSKKLHYVSIEDFEFQASSKREEIEASNHRNSKKDDVIKNQVEDKGECNKLLTEGTRFDANDKTEKDNSSNNSLGHHHKNNDSDKNTRKQNKLDVSKSICKTNADMNQPNIKTRKKQNHDSHLEESNHNRASTNKKIINQNKSYCGNDKQFTSGKQHVEIEQDHTSSNGHTKSSENGVPEPVGSNEKLVEESNSKKSKKKKKQKHSKDQQREDNFHSNKNIEFDGNKQDRPSSIDRKRDMFVKAETRNRFTGNNTDRQQSSAMGRHKSRSSANDIRRSSTSKDGTCILEEINQNLFDLPSDVSLAHCVAEDLRMGAGIAVDFKRIFGGVGSLIDQNLKIGNVGRVNRRNQNAFYLITKKFSNGKPTLITMEKALRTLLSEMNKLDLKKLGIPKIGCGLDCLDWDDVKSLIKAIFDGSGIHITVCIHSKTLGSKAPSPMKVLITPNHLWEMQSKTLIIIPINLEQVQNTLLTDNVVDKVNAKYPFKENLMKDLKSIKLEPGNIKSYFVKNEYIICVFYQQSSYYDSLEKAFRKICSKFKNYLYFAIQSGPVSGDLKRLAWIVLILRSICNSNSGELWLCGDTEQTDNLYYDQYCKDLRNFENRLPNFYSSRSNSTYYNGGYNTNESYN